MANAQRNALRALCASTFREELDVLLRKRVKFLARSTCALAQVQPNVSREILFGAIGLVILICVPSKVAHILANFILDQIREIRLSRVN